MLLQTLNALFLRGLPGSQELNQQLANHFTDKVEHFMHIPHLLFGHIGYLWHALPACIQGSTQSIMAARHRLLREDHLLHLTAPTDARLKH